VRADRTERALFSVGLRLNVDEWDALTPNERVFALLDMVGDGTDLYEYYYWQAGLRATELPAAARLIGAADCAELFEQANALFPPGTIQPPPNAIATSEYLGDHALDFGAIETAFAELNAEGRGIRSALAAFGRLHADEFPEFSD
jgi:hypothetical protein